jgi:uncharacterized protein (TIGR02300 family)
MALAQPIWSAIREGDVAKPEWGVKRTCSSCGARFYDMRRDPIICPKCEATVDPLAQLRPQRSKAVAVPVVEEPVAVVEEVDDIKLVEGDDRDDGTDIEEVEEESEDEDIIEDASELGEDKDDMFEVMDKVNGDEEDPR